MPPEVAELIALFQRGAYDQVIARAALLETSFPREALISVVAGAAHAARGDLPAAVASHRRALAIDPQNIDAHYNLALALQQHGDAASAEASYRAVVTRAPGHAQAQNNLGVVLKQQGRYAEARTAFGAALAAAPDLLDAAVNLATVLDHLGETAPAEAQFRAVLQAAPGLADAWYNYGLLLVGQRRLPEAIEAFAEAAQLRPEHADTHTNLGTALLAMGRREEAVTVYCSALAHHPEAAATWADLGFALAEIGDDEGAIAAWEAALARDPASHRALGFLLHKQACLADWSQRSAASSTDPAGAAQSSPASPFTFLTLDDDPSCQRKRAEAFCRQQFGSIPAAALAAPAPAADGRLRIGYFSADFHDHATLYLMAGVLRCHDRARFEIHAFSFGADRTGMARRAVEQDIEHFHDVADLGDAAVVALARSFGLDVAVDLKGYTRDARTALFARRLAPVQINYLGYPGTMGAPFIDYIMADARVIRPEQRAHYSEAVIYLPGCYQPNDDHRAIAEAAGTRRDHGLPEHGFVFASFNSTYKIGPAEFDVWCRLLAVMPHSVLWLLRGNGRASANLKREAAARGIDPARLVFAEELPQAAHLARLRHADLFLDSFACNAHTTASDALWAGLPVLTLAGRGFAARVAASLITAAGLPELVTVSLAEYEALALALARDPKRLDALRARLAMVRETCALFDTARTTRNLETAYIMVSARQVGGLPPVDLFVPDCNA